MAEPRLCPACSRAVKIGLPCQQTVCPWSLEVVRGQVVLAKPLRLRIK